WTHAPSETARLTKSGNRSVAGSQRYGNRTTVRSWIVTTRPARRVGGTMKFVPWTMSKGPVKYSIGGHESLDHAMWIGLAGIARVTARIRSGNCESI
ncbi:MAG TPA: hypothetical protein VMU77_07115, partial [Acidimicrobiales bacterium]|nr:hypothetical protein [Acidimicrobiales bacterium]